MIRNLGQFFMLLGIFLLPITSFAQPQTYTLDPTHSYVLFHVGHFGFSNPSGKWFANGTLILDKENPQNSKVNVTINVADVDTGLPKLDQHLQGPDFFNVAKYPTATFVSNKIEVSSPFAATVYGTLTLHGVSNPVILLVKFNKAGVMPVTNKETVGFTANTEIRRSEFGMTKYIPDISDEVDLDIEVEANKPN